MVRAPQGSWEVVTSLLMTTCLTKVMDGLGHGTETLADLLRTRQDLYAGIVQLAEVSGVGVARIPVFSCCSQLVLEGLHL
jgi:hypothetical protein